MNHLENLRTHRDNSPAALGIWIAIGVLTAMAYVAIFMFSPNEPAPASNPVPLAMNRQDPPTSVLATTVAGNAVETAKLAAPTR